ncbi:MAG: alpha-galactosidase, partial [Victivallales bacterium]|nr:alpha-galactosidase [Victivallales bacterium]
MANAYSIRSEIPAGWQASLSTLSEDGDVSIHHLHLQAQTELMPPPLELVMSIPLTDMEIYWTPSVEGAQNIMPEWGGSFQSSIAQRAPLFSFISNSDRNRITVAASDALRTIKFTNGVREFDSTLTLKMNLFISPEAPISSYDMDIRIDRRDVFYADAIRDAISWFETYDLYRPLIPPPIAFEAIYSSWYSYHQDLFENEIEAQCKLAKDFGLNGIIVDDGWQTDDNQCTYAFCGEWKVAKRRFADMKAHVARVHAIGMRYLIWFSVPFVGFKTEAFKRFQGKYLYTQEIHQAGVLDPRFPEVREYLINIYEHAVRDWDLDGLKLDFIERFSFDRAPTPDPAIAENYAGRDIKSLETAVDVFLSEVIRRLRLLKPDILIEFRQNYI